MEERKIQQMRIGDRVTKPNGYRFEAVIVSIFKTTSGKIRIVAENKDGILHIFNKNQLKKHGQE